MTKAQTAKPDFRHIKTMYDTGAERVKIQGRESSDHKVNKNNNPTTWALTAFLVMTYYIVSSSIAASRMQEKRVSPKYKASEWTSAHRVFSTKSII